MAVFFAMLGKHPSLLRLASGFFIASIATFPAFAAPVSADLIVYRGTASGVVTAYAAAKEGLRVVLLEPGSHLGGMVTGGLSATDVAHFQVIGGYARDFYREAAAHYGVHTLNKHEDWLSEPKVGEAIFNEWLKAAGVEVHLHERLKEQHGVTKAGTHVTSITTEDGEIWNAKIFADCSYEGDLMAQAGVKYTVGRESTGVYNEDLAGVRVDTPEASVPLEDLSVQRQRQAGARG